MRNRFVKAFKSAAPVGVGTAVLCVAIVLTRWSQIAAGPYSSAVALAGIPVVVFLSYFVLALVGYPVAPDGFVAAPRLVAWVIASLAAIVLIVVIWLIAYLFPFP